MLALLLDCCISSVRAQSEEAKMAAPDQEISSSFNSAEALQWDRALEDAFRDDRYRWRKPVMEQESEAPKDWFNKFFFDLRSDIKSLGIRLESWLKKLGDWLEDWFKTQQKSKPKNQPVSWGFSLNTWMLVCLAITLCALAIFLLRIKIYKRIKPSIEPKDLPPLDLNEENIDPLQNNPEQWLDLVHQLCEQGQLRLALRACFLACLSSLARDGWIELSLGRGNREILRQLQLRRNRDHIAGAFECNLRDFERCWYGGYAVTLADVQTHIQRTRTILGEQDAPMPLAIL